MPLDALTSQRRQPSQRRAHVTVEIIAEAALQLLMQEDWADISMNRVAERAGFAVGTLYQYFPSKETLAIEVYEAHRRSVIQTLSTIRRNAMIERWELALFMRRVVDLMVWEFAGGVTGGSIPADIQALRRFTRQGWHLGSEETMQRCHKQSGDQIDMFLQHVRHSSPDIKVRTDPIAIYTVTRGLYGVVRSASEERSLLLDTDQFPQELTRMSLGFLNVSY